MEFMFENHVSIIFPVFVFLGLFSLENSFLKCLPINRLLNHSLYIKGCILKIGKWQWYWFVDTLDLHYHILTILVLLDHDGFQVYRYSSFDCSYSKSSIGRHQWRHGVTVKIVPLKSYTLIPLFHRWRNGSRILDYMPEIFFL